MLSTTKKKATKKVQIKEHETNEVDESDEPVEPKKKVLKKVAKATGEDSEGNDEPKKATGKSSKKAK